MIKKILVILLVVSVATILVLISRPQGDIDLDRPADIEGVIYDISDNRILVAQGIEGDSYNNDINSLVGNAIWFTLNDDSIIVTDKGKKISSNDLRIEDKVAVWSTGYMLESYPAQATAFKIIQYEEEIIAKECFIGGCSGELCSDISEMPSTCEELPGAFCLKEEGVVCEAVDGECTWVLSQAAAKCFLDVEKEYGELVRESRIGYLFEMAEEF